MRTRWSKQTSKIFSDFKLELKRFNPLANRAIHPLKLMVLAHHLKAVVQINKESFSTYVAKHFEAFRRVLVNEIAQQEFEDVLKGHEEHYFGKDWIDRNAPYHKIKACQGLHPHILEGVCVSSSLGVVYYWMRYSDKKLKDHLLRSGDPNVPREARYFSSKDRFLQAAYCLGNQIGAKSKYDLGSLALKTYGMKQTTLRLPNYAKELRPYRCAVQKISSLQKETAFILALSNHAMAIRCDAKRREFAIWDPNAGLFEYPREKILWTELSNYLHQYGESTELVVLQPAFAFKEVKHPKP